MKMLKLSSLLAQTLVVILLATQCGPSQEELQRREQARQDSIAQVKADSLAKIEAEQKAAEQARLDAERKERERKYVEYAKDGSIALQVEAWRSINKAQKNAEKWKKKGFEQAFVVEHGDEAIGDVWYRVRIARFANREWAEKQVRILKEENPNLETWVTAASETKAPQSK